MSKVGGKPGSSAAHRADFYHDAEVYDALHAPGTGGEAAVVAKIARRLTGKRRGALRFYEPACGTGRHLVALARRGHACVGVDLEPGMVAFAEREAGRMGVEDRARFVCGDMTRVVLDASDRVDAAFCLINSIRHLMSDRAMLAHLRSVRASMLPGGVYVVGIELIEPDLAQPSEDVWSGRKHGVRVKQVVQYLPPEPGERVETVISTMLVRRVGSGGRRGSEQQVDSSYALRTYTPSQWGAIVAKAGFEVAGVFNAEGVPRPRATIGYYLWALRAKG